MNILWHLRGQSVFRQGEAEAMYNYNHHRCHLNWRVCQSSAHTVTIAVLPALTLVPSPRSGNDDGGCSQKAENSGIDLEQHVDYRFDGYELFGR